MNDPDFGIMHFDNMKYRNYWILKHRVNFNGHNIPIQIYPENQDTLAISEVQRQAVKIALNLPTDVLLVSASAVIQNYECYDEDSNGIELPE